MHRGAKTSPSGGGAVGRRGAFLLWSPCRGSPSRAKFVLSLHTKGPSYESPGRCSEVGLFPYGRSPVVWFSLLCCHKLKLTPLPSTHSAPTKLGWQRNWICRGASRPENPVTCFPAGQRWWRQPPKGVLPQAAYILPSEPARSVGRTHRSVRQHMTDRTRAPQAPEPYCVRKYRPSDGLSSSRRLVFTSK